MTSTGAVGEAARAITTADIREAWRDQSRFR